MSTKEWKEVFREYKNVSLKIPMEELVKYEYIKPFGDLYLIVDFKAIIKVDQGHEYVELENIQIKKVLDSDGLEKTLEFWQCAFGCLFADELYDAAWGYHVQDLRRS